MRHGVKIHKLGRDRKHRKAMLNNLATSILLKGMVEEQLERQVVTTLPKAKAVRGVVERLITYGKKGDLSARRQAARFIKNRKALKGLFEVLGERYRNRSGGYTRILKLSSCRHGDSAEMAVITLTENEITPRPKKKSKPKKKTASEAKTAAGKEAKVKKGGTGETAEAAEVEKEKEPEAAAQPDTQPEKVIDSKDAAEPRAAEERRRAGKQIIKKEDASQNGSGDKSGVKDKSEADSSNAEKAAKPKAEAKSDGQKRQAAPDKSGKKDKKL